MTKYFAFQRSLDHSEVDSNGITQVGISVMFSKLENGVVTELGATITVPINTQNPLSVIHSAMINTIRNYGVSAWGWDIPLNNIVIIQLAKGTII